MLNSLLLFCLSYQLSDISTTEIRSGFEEQKTYIIELQNRLADTELKVTEGEKLRKKLHNTILVLISYIFSVVRTSTGQ